MIISASMMKFTATTFLAFTGFQGEMDPHKRHVYLTRFYKTTVGNLLPVSSESSDQDDCKGLIPVVHTYTQAQGYANIFILTGIGLVESLSLREQIPHKITETYTCAKVSRSLGLVTCVIMV